MILLIMSNISFLPKRFTNYSTSTLLYFNPQMNKLKNINNLKVTFDKELKILQLKVKFLVLSNLNFYFNVFEKGVKCRQCEGMG